MTKLFEKTVTIGQPLYLGVWSYNGHTFKISSSLKDSYSVWRIDVRNKNGEWSFETGNCIFENTQAMYNASEASINILRAFNAGITLAEEYIKSVYIN